MEYNIAEQFLILTLRPNKAGYVVEEQTRKVGFIGALLLDLSIHKKIDLENGKLKVLSTESEITDTHKSVLEHITNAKKPRKLKTWISKLLNHSGRYQRQVLETLEEKKIVQLEQRQFLFFKYYRARLLDTELRQNFVQEIRDVVFNSKQADNNSIAILGLIYACKMYKIFCTDKHEKKALKSNLKDIVNDDAMAQGVDKVIKEMQTAVISAIVASTVVITAVNN